MAASRIARSCRCVTAVGVLDRARVLGKWSESTGEVARGDNSGDSKRGICRGAGLVRRVAVVLGGVTARRSRGWSLLSCRAAIGGLVRPAYTVALWSTRWPPDCATVPLYFPTLPSYRCRCCCCGGCLLNWASISSRCRFRASEYKDADSDGSRCDSDPAFSSSSSSRVGDVRGDGGNVATGGTPSALIAASRDVSNEGRAPPLSADDVTVGWLRCFVDETETNPDISSGRAPDSLVMKSSMSMMFPSLMNTSQRTHTLGLAARFGKKAARSREQF
jgi:hypothetical protein